MCFSLIILWVVCTSVYVYTHYVIRFGFFSLLFTVSIVFVRFVQFLCVYTTVVFVLSLSYGVSCILHFLLLFSLYFLYCLYNISNEANNIYTYNEYCLLCTIYIMFIFVLYINKRYVFVHAIQIFFHFVACSFVV